MSAKDFICGSCKRSFASEDATRQHIIDGHKNGGKIGIYRRIGVQHGRDFDDEPSMADLSVGAEIARSMGIHTDDAAREMASHFDAYRGRIRRHMHPKDVEGTP